MSEYKTFEELKEELGDEFEDYMYKANIELLNQLQQKENTIKEARDLLSEYDDNESNYYVPVNIALEILDKE